MCVCASVGYRWVRRVCSAGDVFYDGVLGWPAGEMSRVFRHIYCGVYIMYCYESRGIVHVIVLRIRNAARCNARYAHTAAARLRSANNELYSLQKTVKIILGNTYNVARVC